ncbi:MAG: RHS repeat protein, partial [Cocleimonas sp.]|nr:RHS repeat protein [Cocleimonas sp.]
MFIRIFFFFFLVVLSPVQAASISFDIPLSISVEAGREGRLNFTNKDGVGNYQMHVTGRPSWLTIHNNNDQYRSGYLKMKPQVDDIGDYQMVIWSCQKGSHSICSDKKTVSIRVSGSAEPLNVSIGNFSWVEYTASTQPFSVSGGAPPYSATISGRFSNRDRPFPLMPDQKLTCDNSSTCLPPLVNNDRKFNFTLTIKDSQGATASDSFVITVTNDPKKDAPSSPILRTATVDNSKGKIGLSWTSSTNSPNWYLVTFIGNGKTATKRPSPETGQNLELFETIDLLKRGVEYSVYAQAHNTKGYSKRSNTIKFTLKTKTNQKPTIRCINCPQTGKVNTPLGFTFKTIEPDAEKVINTIKWGDGKKYTSANQNQSEFSLNHRYTSKGTFTIRATAQDSNHNKSTVYTHNIVISQDDTPTNPELPDTFKTSFLLGNPNNHAPATQSAGFGVNAVTGNFHYSDHDASMAGKDIDFSFIRAYNSMVDGKDSFGDAITEPLGRGWTHSYHIQLRFKGQQAEVIWGDGSRDGFIKSGATWLAVTPNNRYQLQAQGNGWLLTTRKKTGYYFDGTGKLSKIESRHKNTLQLTYNGKNLTAITDTAGRKISFAYTGNKLKTISLPLGRTVRYDYTVNGLLKAVTDRRGNVWRYVYQNDRLRVIYQANASENNLDIKKQLQIKYDAQGRVEQQDTGYTASNNSVGHYRFTWGTQTMSFNSPTGQGARYQWDKNYRLTKVTPVNAASGTVPTLQAYSKDGIYALLPDYQKDNKGHKTTLNFGGTGSSDNFDLTKITDPANRQSSLSYTSQHDLKTLTTPTGLQTAIDWKNNSPTRISVSGNNQSTINTQLTHENGLLKRLERGNKTLEITEHNIDGQPKKIVTKDSTGVLVTEQRAYDNAGRLISTQRSLGNTFTCLAYDANDNIDHIISGVSSCSGNLGSVKATASIGHVYLQYDDNNRLIKRTTAYKSAKAQSTTYAYNDKTGKVSRSCHLASTNEKRCKSYQYDKDLRLYEVKTETTGRIDRIHTLQSGALRTVNENAKDTARRITRKAYDPNGNLKSISSCRDMESNNAQADCKSDQKRVQISYDKLDRPTGINVFLDKNKKRYTGIAYSQGGRITTLTEANGNKMRRETDSLGRLIKVTQSKGSESFSSEYAYDDNNNLTKITDPSKLVTTFRYDGLGRRLSRSDLKGTETWAYSKDGLTTTYKAPDGNGITYSHDPAGNLIQLKSSDKFSVNYSYNALGQKTTVNWSGYGRSGQRRYDYTAFGELKTVDSATGKTSYRYDSAGRMKTKQYAGLNIAYGYNGLNQLTQLTGDAGKFTFNHDAFTGALQRQVFPNGVETSYQRNLAGELLGINTQKGSNKILNYALTLDQNGRRKTIQAEQPQGIQQTAENLQFTFTLKGIIDQLNGKKVTYDQRGNITNIPAPFDHAYGYDGLDRVTSSNGIQHQYDD